MSVYESLKVTELKTLIKERQIPAQGLTRKAQFIEALLEDDAKLRATEDTNGADAIGQVVEEQHVDEQTAAADPAAVVDPAAVAETPAVAETLAVVDTATVADPAAETAETAETAEVATETAAAEAQDNSQDHTETLKPHAAHQEVVDAPDSVQHTATFEQKEGDADVVISQPTDASELPAPTPAERKRKRDSVEEDGEDAEASLKKNKTQAVDEAQPEAVVKTQSNVMEVEEQVENNTTNVVAPEDNEEPAGPPSQHAPTTALYIRNLMRPLQAQAFRSELSSLADPSDREQGGAIIDLHLDSLKTHAFVVCSSTRVASHLRSVLHDKPWPQNESQRKLLWVDYVPTDKVAGWVEREQGAGRDARFEVLYEGSTAGDKTAELSDINARQAPREPPQQRDSAPGQGMPGAPQGPRGQRPQPRQAPVAPTEPASKVQSTSFNKLDSYFRSTTAKPKIYFLPVEKDLADRRLDEINRETSRDWEGGRSWNRSTNLTGIDQLRRYTFDDGDRIVDGGMDFGGFGRRQGAGGSGAYHSNAPRGGGGRGGRGGYRS